VLNVYDHFQRISGIYVKDSNETDVIHVESTIDSSIFSISLKYWDDETNVQPGDLRSIKSKEQSVVLSDYWVSGLDFFGDNPGFSDITINLSPNVTVSSSKGDGLAVARRFNNNQTPTFRYVGINEDDNPETWGVFQFNENDYNFFSPTRLKADKNQNFNNAIARVDWTNYDKYTPYSVYKKQLVIYTVHVSSITRTGSDIHIKLI